MYQDIWINGNTIKGTRECSDRYDVIKKFCISENLKNFSVCDIGANMCYFGLRLINDFNCNVIAFEFNSFEKRKAIISQNKTKNLMFVNRKLSIDDIRIMNKIGRFDVVLALSVLHHLPGSSQEWISELKKLGSYTIIEFALSDSHRIEKKKDYFIPKAGQLLGYGFSHLNNSIKRPIILL